MLRIHFDATLIFMTFMHNIYKICETFPPFIRIVCCSPIVSKVKQKTLGFFFFFKIPRKLEFLRFHAKWTKNLWRMFIESVRDMFGSNLLNVKKRVKYFILRVVSSRKVFQHISIYFNNNNIIIIIFRKNDCSCKFDSYSWFFSNFTIEQETKRINNKISNNHFYHNAIIFKIFSKHFWSMLYINFYRFSFYCWYCSEVFIPDLYVSSLEILSRYFFQFSRI